MGTSSVNWKGFSSRSVFPSPLAVEGTSVTCCKFLSYMKQHEMKPSFSVYIRIDDIPDLSLLKWAPHLGFWISMGAQGCLQFEAQNKHALLFSQLFWATSEAPLAFFGLNAPGRKYLMMNWEERHESHVEGKSSVLPWISEFPDRDRCLCLPRRATSRQKAKDHIWHCQTLIILLVLQSVNLIMLCNSPSELLSSQPFYLAYFFFLFLFGNLILLGFFSVVKCASE